MRFQAGKKLLNYVPNHSRDKGPEGRRQTGGVLDVQIRLPDVEKTF